MKFLWVLLLLCGCAATSANYNRGLQRWVGQPEVELYQQWGSPDNVFYLTPDEKVVTFMQVDNGPIAGKTNPYTGEVYYPAITTPNYDYPTNAESQMYYCRTSFTITNGVVTDYSFNGDDCVARN